MIKIPNGANRFMFKFVHKIDGERVNCQLIIPHTYVTGYGKTDHFAHNFKIELLVFKGSVDLKQ